LLLPNVLSQENSICHGYAKSDNFEITLWYTGKQIAYAENWVFLA
jgi:hypothetical protein